MIEGTTNGSVSDVLLTRAQLALELKVSLRTVDMMLADGDITPVRLRGKLVRFYLPDVFQELREKAKTSKRNVARRV
jgi:excisionase family DNA binding protein